MNRIHDINNIIIPNSTTYTSSYLMKNFINMKRWNTEPEYQTTLRKTLLGKDYELTPDSPLWIFPIPLSASSINPNLTPNY